MPGLGYITTNTWNRPTESIRIPTDESVCGMIFDYSDFLNPFDTFPIINQYLGNEQVIRITSLEEAEMYGISDNGFLNGVVYYHISQFFKFASKSVLYISLVSNTDNWDCVHRMQAFANGAVFQIGIWTTKPLFNVRDEDLVFSPLVTNIQKSIDEVSGVIGKQSQSSTPLSVILSANTSDIDESIITTLYSLPNGSEMNCPKVSVLLMQNGTDEVRVMQQMNPHNAPVGCIGACMAFVSMAYAEECIGNVEKFNINVYDDYNDLEIPFGDSFYSVNDIDFSVADIISQKCYIIPCKYNGKEAEFFFSGDPTLSNGDYLTLSNNRIMHKVKRIVYTSLLPYIGAGHIIDASTGELYISSQSMITESIIGELDKLMKNIQGERQIASQSVAVTRSSDVLRTDSIEIGISVVTLDYSSVINENDEYEV